MILGEFYILIGVLVPIFSWGEWPFSSLNLSSPEYVPNFTFPFAYFHLVKTEPEMDVEFPTFWNGDDTNNYDDTSIKMENADDDFGSESYMENCSSKQFYLILT